MFYISCKFQKRNEKSENAFCFKDNSVWICCAKVSMMRREYLYSAVKVLTKSPNILDLTKADFFQLHLSQIHGKIGK